MRKTYLQEHRPARYNHLLLSEKLYPHLFEIDQAANERLAQLMPPMIKAAGITERLKATDQMKWVGLMNTVKAQVEEIIYAKLIYGIQISGFSNVTTGTMNGVQVSTMYNNAKNGINGVQMSGFVNMLAHKT